MTTETSSVELFDTQAEQACLGSCLFDRAAAALLIGTLEEPDFYLGHHQRTWRAVEKCGAGGGVVDLLTVTNALRDSGDLETVGGAEYLAACIEAVPTAAHCQRYAGIVLDYSRRRKGVAAARDIESGLVAGTMQPEDALAKFLPLQTRGREETVAVKALTGQYMDFLETYLRAEPGAEPPLLGIPSLDKALGGLGHEELVVIKAEEKFGKTSLLRQSALATAQWLQANGKPEVVLVYHLEGSWRGWMGGALAYLGGIERRDLMRGALHMPEGEEPKPWQEEVWGNIVTALGRLDSLPLRFNTSLRTLAQITADVLFHQARGMIIRGIYVDYLQKLQAPGQTSTEQVRAASDGLVQLHEQSGVPIITASQVTPGDGGQKTTYFGRAVQMDASLVFALERGDDKCKNSDVARSSPRARLINVASRYHAALAPTELTFDGDRACFREAPAIDSRRYDGDARNS